MSDLVCPMPAAVDYKTAKSTYSQVRKDTNYKLSPDANRREAARRLGMGYDEFTDLLASKGKTLTPKPPAPAPVVPKPSPTIPNPAPPIPKPPVAAKDMPWQLAKFKMDEITKRRPKMSRAAQERLAAKEMGMDINIFRGLLKSAEMENAARQGWLDDLPRIKEPGHADAYNNTNPSYTSGYGANHEWSINCAKVVNAYELRLRGFAVTATKGSARMNPFELVQLWRRTDGSGMAPQMRLGRKQKVIDDMQAFDDGARFQVTVVWPGRQSSHIFNARKVNGEIKFFDAQVRRLDASDYLNRADGDIIWWRVDNAVPSRQMLTKDMITTKATPAMVRPTVQSVNKVLEDIGIKRSTTVKGRTTHDGKSYGGGDSRTRGYTTRQIGDQIHISYYDANAYGDDIANAMAKMKKRLEEQGYRVERGFLRTDLIVNPNRKVG